MRIAVTPQRWPARRDNVRGFPVDTDVFEDLSDLRVLGNEGDRAQERVVGVNYLDLPS